MSVGSNCLLRGWGQSVWGQSVLGSKCLWGQNVFFWLGVKVSLGSKCLWGQNVLRVKVSWGQSVFGVKMSVGSKCLWGQNGCEPFYPPIHLSTRLYAHVPYPPNYYVTNRKHFNSYRFPTLYVYISYWLSVLCLKLV